MGEVKEIKGLLGDFTAQLREHDSGETPGVTDISKAPSEVRQKLYENFVDMMDSIYELVNGEK